MPRKKIGDDDKGRGHSTTHHRLVPISPFADHGDYHRDGPRPRPLKLPGRLGREALLRPISAMCPTCRGRRRPPPPHRRIDDGTTRPSCSSICESIRSMAKFIPREDFWNFTFHRGNDGGGGGGRGTMRLEISGNDTHRLVRILRRADDGSDECATTTIPAECIDVGDPRVLLLNEGDVVSLLWHDERRRGREMGGAMIDYSALVPLVRYRITRIDREDAGVDPANDPPDVLAGLIDSGNAGGGDVAPLIQGDIHDAENEPGGGSLRHDDDGEKDVTCNNKGSSFPSSSSSGEEHSINIDGFVRSVTKELGNRPRDARVKYDDIFRDRENHQHLGDGRIEPTAKGMDDDACLESAKGSSREEDETESAPLTLPSRFLASYSNSFSFESVENSPSIAHASSGADISECIGPTTPQKHYNYMESIEAADNTPKKSNITIEDKKYKSVSMSSLSYNQLVQLHKEATPPSIINETSPSLRRTVLSLTLALTSNVSIYDSYFLNDCNAEAEEMLPKQGRQWMPRLLQGTHINNLQER